MSAAMQVKVVVVTMFDVDHEETSRGEFKLWREHYPLDQKLAFPQGFADLRYNAERGVLGMVTGVGTARAAASVMALGMDPRFDLSKAYWLVAGIAGADPAQMTLGSAAWADFVVDGDLSYEIDPREIPGHWPIGRLPLGKLEPYEKPRNQDNGGAVYRLDKGLVDWAYGLTADMALEDAPALAPLRARFADHPSAQTGPRVQRGDTLSAATFWHGRELNAWARDWVNYWSDGEGTFVTSAMEDTGTLQALTLLDKAGKVDLRRALVLRTASNFTMPPDGISAHESLSEEKKLGFSAFGPSLQSAYVVGRKVVDALVDNWDAYGTRLPGAADL